MKAKTIASILALSCITGLAFAEGSPSYYPPERIHCKMNEMNKISCNDFDRRYLSEDGTNADLRRKDETFYFYSAAAYFTGNQKEAVVFFTYHNADGRMVKLRTIDPAIKPDFPNGIWKQFNEDIYICDTGYLECPITNLPA